MAPIVVANTDDVFTIEDTDAQEDITIFETNAGEFEIEANLAGGLFRGFVLTREQMKELRDWMVERLR